MRLAELCVCVGGGCARVYYYASACVRMCASVCVCVPDCADARARVCACV